MASKLRKYRRKTKRNGNPPVGRPPGVPWTRPKKNPSGQFMAVVTEEVLPGVGGFAATKAVGRIATSIVGKRWPGFAKHAGVIAALATFGASLVAASKVKKLARYETPLQIGAGAAAFQTMFQTYFKKWGWLIGTPDDSENVPLLPAATAPAATGDDNLLAELGHSASSDPAFAYNDAMDAGRYAQQPASPSQPSAAGANASDVDSIDDLMSEMESDDNLQGIFAN